MPRARISREPIWPRRSRRSLVSARSAKKAAPRPRPAPPACRLLPCPDRARAVSGARGASNLVAMNAERPNHDARPRRKRREPRSRRTAPPTGHAPLMDWK
jgi:hypothetical protein